jgi:hypothetical protein
MTTDIQVLLDATVSSRCLPQAVLELTRNKSTTAAQFSSSLSDSFHWLQLRLIKRVPRSPRKGDNIPIQDGDASVIRLDIIYDGGQSSERARIISPDYHVLSDLKMRLLFHRSRWLESNLRIHRLLWHGCVMRGKWYVLCFSCQCLGDGMIGVCPTNPGLKQWSCSRDPYSRRTAALCGEDAGVSRSLISLTLRIVMPQASVANPCRAIWRSAL